jgi:hypothetical protein
MKVQEVILKAMAGSLKWWEAAEIIGVSDRTMRRWREFRSRWLGVRRLDKPPVVAYTRSILWRAIRTWNRPRGWKEIGLCLSS